MAPKVARSTTWHEAPAEGTPYSIDSRRTTLFISTGESELAPGAEAELDVPVVLDAWCRVGVWTTLQRIQGRPFLVRESWGRLGEKKPRRLHQTYDDLITGVIARVRPEADGSLRFRIEVADGETVSVARIGDFEGNEVLFPAPRRFGYRFDGTVLPGVNVGVIARWSPGVEIRLGDATTDEVAPKRFRFRAGSANGFVVGTRGRVEAFSEQWGPAPPVIVDDGGILRGEFRFGPPSLFATGAKWEFETTELFGSEFEGRYVDTDADRR
ncbi:MAG: hypothetical protein V3T86_15960 [Planctomycetota bacterium]